MNCKKDMLLDAPCPELLCGLCDDILDDPMQVHCSEDHMFCRFCLNNYQKASCPSCMEPLDKATFQLSKFVKRQISRLRVRCINRPSGCTWEGLLEDDHHQSCSYQTICCSNSQLGCSEIVKIMDLDQHKTKCLYELISCPNGSTRCQPFLRKNSALHDSSCSSFHCPFAHEGCPFVGTLPEVNRHCESYCGKLHERIRYLELQCSQMKQQLNQQSDVNSIGTIVNNSSDNNNSKNNNNDNYISDSTMATTNQDSSMDEMALFHQMFSENFLSITSENNVDTSKTPPMINNNNTDMMDLSACLPDLSLSTPPANPQQQHQEQSKDSPSLAPPMTLLSSFTANTPAPAIATAPKRSSNGKIIRYSKNKQLAHGALRMARQRSSSGSGLTTQAILHALNDANKIRDEDISMYSSTNPPPMSTSPSLPVPSTNTETNYTSLHQLSPSSSDTTTKSISSSSNNPSYSFKNLEDVTKFLEELPPIVEASPFLPSQHTRKASTKSKTTIDRPGKSKPDGDKRLPKTPTSSSTPKSMELSGTARPMYVLASTLLSKHSQDN